MDRGFFLKSCAACFVALAALAAPNPASAQLAIFSTEAAAQLHCPSDQLVWLDFKKRRYYTRGQKLYARGRDATYACLKEAKRSGYKRSRLGLR